MSAEVLIAAALLVLALLVALFRPRGSHRVRIEEALPAEFRDARLVLNEPRLPLRRRRPVAVAAKPDRAYRLADGTIALLEIKTRFAHQVREADIVQLSLQRYVMLAHPRWRGVRPEGYVATVRPSDRSVQVHRVRLLPETELLQIIRRYDDLLAGRVQPRWPPDVARCRHCPHLARCAHQPGAAPEPREANAWNSG